MDESSIEKIPQDFAEGKDNFAETDGETQEVYRASAETAEAAGMKTEELQEIADEVLRQVPELMENPVIIMESKTQPNRITLLGEVYAENGIPVFGVVELMPISRNGKKIDAWMEVQNCILSGL